MKMKLKNSDILEFYQTLTMINGVKNTNFNFVKAQNKAALQRKADPLTETQKEVFAHIEKYNAEHLELVKKHATKDEDGNPKVKEKRGYMTIYDLTPKAEEKLKAELKALREKKYKKNFDTYEKENKKFEAILNQQQEVEIIKFNKKDLPSDLDDVMDVLYKYIE